MEKNLPEFIGRKKMSTVRWGVLGTSGIAEKQLLPAFERASNAKVVAIASQSNLAKAKELASTFHIDNIYDSYEKLLADSSIQAIYLPLPNHLHKKWAIKAAESGKHILCEKPAGLTAEEVKAIQKACEDNQVLFMEGFMYHFHPQHQRVKELIASGNVGEVRSMRAAFTFHLTGGKRVNSIKLDRQKGGGSLYDVGCYAIHSIRNILGQEPESVYTHVQMNTDNDVDEAVHGYLQFSNGLHASFDVSFSAVNQRVYEVIGTEGLIRAPRAYRPDEYGGEAIVTLEKDKITQTERLYGDQYCLEVEHISEAILSGNTDLKHDFENSIQNMKVMDACFESIQTGKKAYVN